MQQTKIYKLNLIETSDTFSPEALNENAKKTEAAIAAGDAAEALARAAGDAALDQRVQVLELRRFVAGYYVGNGIKQKDSQTIELGFTPVVVFIDVIDPNHVRSTLCVEGFPMDVLKIVPGGFQVIHDIDGNDRGNSANISGHRYRYAAFC